MKKLDRAGSHRLRIFVAAVNLGWAVWALIGGFALLRWQQTQDHDPSFDVLSNFMHGYEVGGISLLTCGVISLLSVLFHKLREVAAILCAVWCAVMAGLLQLAVARFDFDVWLLLMCALTCVMRWGLYRLEPYLGH